MRKLKFKVGFCFCTLLLIAVGCGKKPENSKDSSASQKRTETVQTDLGTYLAKQEVICEEGEVCPNYIAKVVVFENRLPKFCTGFLVSDDIVATSTSCLPQLLRLKDQDCENEVTFFFPKTNGKEAERVSCLKVLQVSELTSKDPVLWRDDLAFLKLEKKMSGRRSLVLSREGVEDQRDYTLWGIDQIDNNSAFIRRDVCKAVHESWINPFSNKETSPNSLFAGCPFKSGFSGAPLLDSKGRVRATVSQMMNVRLKDYLESTGLLAAPLKELFHATNFSCAPTVFDTVVKDERECTKLINQASLESRRTHMIQRLDLYEGKKKELESKLSGSSKFFNFEVTLISQGEFKRAAISPKCFKDVPKWINGVRTTRGGNYVFDMTFPQVGLKRTMDSVGKIDILGVDNGKINLKIQFSVKQLKNQAKSDVYVWNDDFENVHQAVPESCR